MPPLLDIDKIRANPNAKVILKTPGGTVTGFMLEDFGFGVSNQFNTPWDTGAGQTLTQVGQAVGTAAANVAGNFSGDLAQFMENAGKRLATMKVQSLEQTVLSWTGSSKPQFSLPLLFLATKKTADVRSPIKVLLSGCAPVQSSAVTLDAPWRYNAVNAKGADGTMTVFIGKWFRAPNVVLNGVEFSFSKVCIPNGTPLYARVTVRFEPFRLLLANELLGYFVGGK